MSVNRRSRTEYRKLYRSSEYTEDIMSCEELRNFRRKLRMRRVYVHRCIVFLAAVCLTVLCMVSYSTIRSSAKEKDAAMNFKYYTDITVAKGETLWEIADTYIDYEQYRDKNEYIAEVRSINHMQEDELIRAGQKLVVPYYSTDFIK